VGDNEIDDCSGQQRQRIDDNKNAGKLLAISIAMWMWW
jgi:hypothetical protein